MVNVVKLGDIRTHLGEGPYWDPIDQVLYFLDKRGRAIWRYDPSSGTFRSWSTPEEPAAVSRTTDGRFIAVLADGFYDFDPSTGRISLLARVSDLRLEESHLNDAKVDRQGRFVAAGAAKPLSHPTDRPPIAKVVSLEGTTISTLDAGYRIGNGPCWSPDGRTFYLADSIERKIYAFEYDTDSGSVGARRLFADVSAMSGVPDPLSGTPDGATVDAQGRLWSVLHGAGNVVCFTLDGSVDMILETPVRWLTSIQFGGPDLDEMYVTSLDPTQIGQAPDDSGGYLYRVEGHGTRGLPEPVSNGTYKLCRPCELDAHGERNDARQVSSGVAFPPSGTPTG